MKKGLIISVILSIVFILMLEYFTGLGLFFKYILINLFNVKEEYVKDMVYIWFYDNRNNMDFNVVTFFEIVFKYIIFHFTLGVFFLLIVKKELFNTNSLINIILYFLTAIILVANTIYQYSISTEFYSFFEFISVILHILLYGNAIIVFHKLYKKEPIMAYRLMSIPIILFIITKVGYFINLEYGNGTLFDVIFIFESLGYLLLAINFLLLLIYKPSNQHRYNQLLDQGKLSLQDYQKLINKK